MAELIRNYGISEQTFYRCKAKFAALDFTDAKHLKQLQKQNRRPNKLLADQALDILMLKQLAQGKD